MKLRNRLQEAYMEQLVEKTESVSRMTALLEETLDFLSLKRFWFHPRSLTDSGAAISTNMVLFTI